MNREDTFVDTVVEMVSRAAYHVITFLLVMTASVGSFHVPTARRPRVHLAAKSPMERFDEVLDYFEGKVIIKCGPILSLKWLSRYFPITQAISAQSHYIIKVSR